MYRDSQSRYAAKRFESPATAEVFKQKNLRRKASNQKWAAKAKEEVFAYYGGKCICCGESNLGFLTLDHVNGGGTAHRKAYSSHGRLYANVRKLGFPNDFQILCMNCNWGRHRQGRNGICPHKDTTYLSPPTQEEER